MTIDRAIRHPVNWTPVGRYHRCAHQYGHLIDFLPLLGRTKRDSRASHVVEAGYRMKNESHQKAHKGRFINFQDRLFGGLELSSYKPFCLVHLGRGMKFMIFGKVR